VAERRRHRRRVREHCIQGAPSRPFLEQLCGQAWTERYLGEFLYPAFLAE
jgi:hypothetical protein